MTARPITAPTPTSAISTTARTTHHNRFRFFFGSGSGWETTRLGVARGGRMAAARPAAVLGEGVLFLFRRRGARNDGMRLAVVEVDDIGDDDGDVVGTAAAQRQFDETVGALLLRALAHRVLDGLVADHVGEAVGAEQVTIPGASFAHGERRLDLVTGQRPHDQGSLRVRVPVRR
ncbi:hypothetical protein GCM10020255_040290 [Rhodococcus baikonurensis]